ncbi:receptor-type tyrosine-protein phosphatase C-like [Dicentrarchus labrax]|uniref:receptor-type tyrosine-protein phosphatase C-like n=1 Tax=Dicentrarchus labrax TaxID=13489 RepID=UPI0021F5E1E5|nr:receptor-type tyrosine-protein phosphatase C-like [Dicentrarchus labrax]
MTVAPVVSSTTQTTAHIPPLTSQTLTSESSNQTLSSNTTSASPLPANTSSSPTDTSTSREPDSQTNQTHNATSPPTTAPNTTVITTIPASTPAPPPPQCDYTVVPIKFGLEITLTKGSTAGNYIIKVKEGRLEKETTIIHQDSNQTSSHNIKHLKPCTAYEHSVAFIDSTGEQTTCNSTGNETITTPGMKETDIDDVSCIPGYVCYRSEWNIRSSFSTPNTILAVPCQSDRNAICIKPGYNDICSDLTTIFTSGNCVNSSFIKTKSISVDFLNASEINQVAPTGLPVEIKPTLPPNCYLTVDYTCQENGNPNNTKQLSELEPFTDYSCTGQIKNIIDVIITNTPAIKFSIECDIEIITDRSMKPTDTSFNLSWTTTSENCKDLPNLPKLSYHCSCGTKHSGQRQATVNKQGGTCTFTGLEAFTVYTCKVQPTYNNKDVGRSTEIRPKTDIGVPTEVTNLKVDLVEHNVIKVTCHTVNNFNGPKKIYIACLNDCHDKNLKQEKNKCEFEFKDLSYLTTYKVKVTGFNGRRESKPVMKVIDTSYNDKALIGSLVFLIILIPVALLFYKIYIRKCRKSHDVNDDMMLDSEAIYVNARPPGWRHREAR